MNRGSSWFAETAVGFLLSIDTLLVPLLFGWSSEGSECSPSGRLFSVRGPGHRNPVPRIGSSRAQRPIGELGSVSSIATSPTQRSDRYARPVTPRDLIRSAWQDLVRQVLSVPAPYLTVARRTGGYHYLKRTLTKRARQWNSQSCEQLVRRYL